MASFASWPAALAGFRLVRERPLDLLAWAGVIFVGRLGATLTATAVSGPYMPALNAAVNAPTVNPEALARAYEAVAPGYVAGALVTMPFVAVVTAAIYRAYLQPEEQQGFFLRLGRRELAIVGLTIAINVLLMLGLFVAAGLVTAAATLAGTADAAAGQLVGLLGVAVVAFGVIWTLARLSLAWPMTFQDARVRLFASWRTTREHAWTLLAAFFMAEGLMLLVAILILAVAGGLGGAAALLTGGSLESVSESLKSPTAPVQVLRPLPLFFLAAESVLLALWAAALEGVAVSAYRTLRPPAAPRDPTRAWQ